MQVLDEYNMRARLESNAEDKARKAAPAVPALEPVPEPAPEPAPILAEADLPKLQKAIVIMWPLFSQTLAWAVHQREEEIPIIGAEAGLVRSDDVAQVIDTIMAVLRATKRARL